MTKGFIKKLKVIAVCLIIGSIVLNLPEWAMAQRGGGPTGTFDSLSCGVNQTVSQGSAAYYTIAASTSGGFNSNITVTFSSSPSGPSGSNLPFTLSYNANPAISYTNTAIIDTSSANPGTYTLTFTGTGASVRTCQVNLIVQSAIFVDLQFNSQNGPVTLTPSDGGQGTLSWTAQYANSCVGSMTSGSDTSSPTSWTGSQAVPSYPSTESFVVNNMQNGSSYTFKITCSDGFGNSVEDTVSVSIEAVQPPTSVTLYCDRASGPHDTVCAVVSGGYGILIWETTSATSCTMTDNQLSTANWPNGGVVNPLNEPDGQTTGNMTTNTTYTLTCTGPGGQSDSDTVLMDTYIMPEEPNAPIISVDNSACGYLQIIMSPGETPPDFNGWFVGWGTDPENITYELAGAPDPIPVERDGGGVIQPMIWYHGTTVEPPDGVDPDRYTYNPEPEINNYYKIAAINTQTADPGPVDSEYNFQVWATGTGSVSSAINVDPCNISVNSSDLDILKVGGKTNNNPDLDECTGLSDNDGHEPMPGNNVYSDGQIVTYEINICNNGNYAMSDIVVTDTLQNLTVDESSFQYSNNCGAATPYEYVSKTEFKLYLDDLPAPPVGDVSVCSVTFQAEITSPDNPVRSNYKFKNTALVNVSGSSDTLNSNEYLFDIGVGAPIRRESTP